jgi:hypothetical protein
VPNADLIRNSPAARTVSIARAAVRALRDGGWQVREAAMHSAGIADAVAIRRWQGRGLSAEIRLVALAHGGEGPGVFAATESAAEAMPSFCFEETRTGEETASAGTRVTPAPARARASLFQSDDASLAAAVELMFRTIPALLSDLHDHELEVFQTDSDTLYESGIEDDRARAPHVTFVHPLVVTAAPLYLLGDAARLTPRASVRLIRTRAAGGERRWIDLLGAGAFPAFVEHAARHYDRAFRRRRLEPVR